ncbi:MAG TPA: hypothetical protein DDY70_04515, partial [Clostridiales bacterium]|nr:hypothetical protein [Clostridiales bacterium]
MDIPAHAYRALLVSAPGKLSASLSALLSDGAFSKIATEVSATGARQQMTADAYDIVVINTPLPDEFGT